MTILACDLGGTRLKIGVVRDGKVLAQAVEPAHSQLGLAPQLPVLRAAWLRLLGGLKLTPADCAGVTVAFPSLVDNATGRILAEYGKFADAMSLDLRAWARAELGLPLAIENDARMALIGEWRAGAGQGCDNLVMMTLGTGLGVCALIEGRVLRGKHGQAGVLGGHLTVRYGGRRCNCGNLGCAEAEASTAFLRQLAEESPGWSRSSLRFAAALDYAEIFAQANAGDACAVALRDHSLRVWGALAVNLIHAYDPEVLILGGGIMASADVILPAVAEHVRRHAHTPWGKVRVVPSALGDRAALVAGEWLLGESANRVREQSREGPDHL
ncbi:MAG: ROK family protein [Lacunisphaera sp.]|nr:ROK family protein [Lacunisphaera sp.]